MPLNYTTNLGFLERCKNDLAFSVRRKVFELFMRECSPRADSRVADFGVSGHRSHRAHYFFEELYPYRESLTAIGRASEEAGWLPEQFPGMHYLEADLRRMSLPDRYFEYGICNAVVEHAGSREQQMALVHEVCRVWRQRHDQEAKKVSRKPGPVHNMIQDALSRARECRQWKQWRHTIHVCVVPEK